MHFTTAQKVTKHLGYFFNKNVAKKLQKAPNLVTLSASTAPATAAAAARLCRVLDAVCGSINVSAARWGRRLRRPRKRFTLPGVRMILSDTKCQIAINRWDQSRCRHRERTCSSAYCRKNRTVFGLLRPKELLELLLFLWLGEGLTTADQGRLFCK